MRWGRQGGDPGVARTANLSKTKFLMVLSFAMGHFGVLETLGSPRGGDPGWPGLVRTPKLSKTQFLIVQKVEMKHFGVQEVGVGCACRDVGHVSWDARLRFRNVRSGCRSPA